jgi:hypothetical protein
MFLLLLLVPTADVFFLDGGGLRDEDMVLLLSQPLRTLVRPPPMIGMARDDEVVHVTRVS